MLLEGVPAPSIEQASNQAGYPAPVLQLSDELNMELSREDPRGHEDAVEAEGGTFADRTRRSPVVDHMLDGGTRRAGSRGAGFYDYEDGKRTGLWKGLKEPSRRPTTRPRSR